MNKVQCFFHERGGTARPSLSWSSNKTPVMSLQTFYGKGPHLLLWAFSRAPCWKLTVSDIPNHLNYCVIFMFFIQFTNAAAGRTRLRPVFWDSSDHYNQRIFQPVYSITTASNQVPSLFRNGEHVPVGWCIRIFRELRTYLVLTHHVGYTQAK